MNSKDYGVQPPQLYNKKLSHSTLRRTKWEKGNSASSILQSHPELPQSKQTEKTGKLVFIEGNDFVGKSTVISGLCDKYGYENFREPGYKKQEYPDGELPMQERIRNLVIGEGDNFTDLTNLLLLNAARCETCIKDISDRMKKGETVIVDRSVMSAMVVQGYVDLNVTIKEAIISEMRKQTSFDMVCIYLYLPVSIIEERKAQRIKENGEINRFDNDDLMKRANKYESIYHRNQREHFFPCNIVKITNYNSTHTVDKIQQIINDGNYFTHMPISN